MVRPNKERENTRSALAGMGRVFDEGSEIVSTLPALAEAVGKFNADHTTYLQGEEAYNLAMSGLTQAKHNAEEELIDVVYTLSRALKPYAKKANRPDIQEVADVEVYELERKRDTDLLAHCKALLKKANEVSGELGSYNVTPEELADVQSKIDAYEKALKAQGGGMAAQSGEFAAMLDALKVVKEDLEEIDDLIERLRKSNPKFCTAYESARRVKELGTRHNPPSDGTDENPAES